jgi:hypothetical protein
MQRDVSAPLRVMREEPAAAVSFQNSSEQLVSGTMGTNKAARESQG